MKKDGRSETAPIVAAARRRKYKQAFTRDPALWVWLVVAVLALLPLGTVLAGK